MTPNPLIGVLFHWLGGLSSASFYVPYKRIRLWSWEIFWLTGGIFSWLIAPWLGAFIGSKDLLHVLSSVPSQTLLICYLCGAGWGLGGLTFGLTMRYLGLSLGMAVALGLTTVIGTMGPPLIGPPISDVTFAELIAKPGSLYTFLGIAIVIVGIVIVAMAGGAKEKQLADVSGDANVPNRGEFDLRKGILIAIFSGVMSSFFSFGLAAGKPIQELSAAVGTGPLWVGLPVLCVVLAGGFTTNFLWCLYLIAKNKSAGEWTGKTAGEKPPLLANYALAALGGTLWYFQFFFYTMGESQMGEYGFSSWTLHMASIILFSTLWGFALKEWKGTANRTQFLVWLGIGTLIISTVIIGIGNMLGR